ncbi:MAG: cupredoxin domain-containing protein [Chloroflexota bacterium]
MKTRVSILLSLALTLAGCGSGSTEWTPLPSGAEPPAACARADADGVIAISADQLRFSAPCMVAPAGVAFMIRFTNDESDVHNVAIYADRSKAAAVIVGDTISGPNKTIDYPVEVLAAGEYYFDCTIHPAMNGALYVR